MTNFFLGAMQLFFFLFLFEAHGSETSQCLPFFREGMDRTHPIGPDIGGNKGDEQMVEEFDPLFSLISKKGAISQADISGLRRALGANSTYNHISAFELDAKVQRITIGHGEPTLSSRIGLGQPTSKDWLVPPITFIISKNEDGSFSVTSERKSQRPPAGLRPTRNDAAYVQIDAMRSITWALRQDRVYGQNAGRYDAAYKIEDGKCAPWKIPSRNINAPACLRLASQIEAQPELLSSYKRQREDRTSRDLDPELAYCKENEEKCRTFTAAVGLDFSKEWRLYYTPKPDASTARKTYHAMDVFARLCSSTEQGHGYNPVGAFAGQARR